MRLFFIVLVAIAVWLGVRMLQDRADPTALPKVDFEPAAVAQTIDDSQLRRDRLKWANGFDSFLPLVLSDGDSALRKWPDRQVDPLRVYIGDTGPSGFNPSFGRVVRNAFEKWRAVGTSTIPINYTYVNNPTNADVEVKWITVFPGAQAGRADVTWDSDGWIHHAELTLAIESSGGFRYDEDIISTVALHEIGHLLGMGHSDRSEDVMHPEATIHGLTTRDRMTARLLYSIPPGSYRGL